MRTRLIPRTTLEASVLCLGTAEFGSVRGRFVIRSDHDRYIEAGGNVLDTAEMYAEWIPGGSHRSEEFLGRWLHKRKNREGLILSTKGAHPRLDSMDKPRMSRKEVEFDLDSSLQRLGVDYVDLYWLHRDDPGTPVEEILLTVGRISKSRKDRLRRIFQLDTSSRGGGQSRGGKAGCSGIHRKSESMEPGESGCFKRRSDMGVHR